MVKEAALPDATARCSVNRGRLGCSAVSWFVKEDSFHTSFLLYYLVVTWVEYSINHINTELCLPSLALLELNTNPSKQFHVCPWTPGFCSLQAIDSRERVEAITKIKVRLSCCFLLPPFPALMEPQK